MMGRRALSEIAEKSVMAGDVWFLIERRRESAAVKTSGMTMTPRVRRRDLQNVQEGTVDESAAAYRCKGSEEPDWRDGRDRVTRLRSEPIGIVGVAKVEEGTSGGNNTACPQRPNRRIRTRSQPPRGGGTLMVWVSRRVGEGVNRWETWPIHVSDRVVRSRSRKMQ